MKALCQHLQAEDRRPATNVMTVIRVVVVVITSSRQHNISNCKLCQVGKQHNWLELRVQLPKAEQQYHSYYINKRHLEHLLLSRIFHSYRCRPTCSGVISSSTCETTS